MMNDELRIVVALRALFFLLALSAVSTAHAATVEQLVAASFPAEIKVDNAGEPLSESNLDSSYVSADLDHSGHPLVVAVYSNGHRAALSILSPDSGAIVSTTTFRGFGYSPDITLLDLDRDLRPEIIVTFHHPRGGPQAWIFRWHDANLSVLGLSAEDRYSDIFDPTFIDVDGDGSLDVLSYHPGTERGSYDLYLMKDGDLVDEGFVDEVFSALRGTGKSSAQTATFPADENRSTRKLIVVNGDANGNHRAASAVVKINGRTIISNRNLDATVGRVELPVRLRAENTLSLQLEGTDSDAEITVVVMLAGDGSK